MSVELRSLSLIHSVYGAEYLFEGKKNMDLHPSNYSYGHALVHTVQHLL